MLGLGPAWLAGRPLPLRELSARQFEEFCELLLRLETPDAKIFLASGSQDFGADILVRGDELTLYQCKRYSGTLGVGQVRLDLAKIYANTHFGELPEVDAITFLSAGSVSFAAYRLLNSPEEWTRCAERALARHIGAPPPPDLLDFALAWRPRLGCVTGSEIGARAEKFPKLVEKFFSVTKVVTGDVADIIEALGHLFAPGRSASPKNERPIANVPQRGQCYPPAERGEERAALPLGDGADAPDHFARIIVVGTAGAGKSLLLRRIATRHRDEAVEIDLAEFDPSPAGSISLALNGMAMLRGSRQEAAQRSDVVLPILDGVDQLQKPFLEQLGAALLPRQRWILSARSLHDVPLRLRQSADATFVLDPLDDDEVERIVGNPSEPGRTTIAELRRQGLLEICRIPLFAHLVGALLRTDDEVPNSEAALLLRVFQRLVGPASTLELSRLDAYLRSLSFLFTRRGLASLKAADIAEALGPGAEGMYREAIRAGILVGAERVRFVHQRFQEAFAALAMVDAMTARRSPRELTNGLEWWNIGWWREPARMATQLRGGDFLKWLATDHPADSLDLTNEVGDIEPDLARAILRAARPRLGDEDARGACAALGVVDELEPLVRRGAGLDRRGLPQLEWLDCGGGLHVARYPVTNAQFRAYDSHRSPSHGAPRYAGDERWSDPVAGVTWQDAVDFCAWLSAQADLAIRLPAIAEWEIAAGGAEREYSWGVWMPGVCNVRATRIGARSPVGAFPRGNSPCGAADMSGNVWEWCIDSEGDRRAAKGGSWASYAHHATIAFTHWLDPQLRLDEVGFRPIMIRAFEVPH